MFGVCAPEEALASRMGSLSVVVPAVVIVLPFWCLVQATQFLPPLAQEDHERLYYSLRSSENIVVLLLCTTRKSERRATKDFDRHLVPSHPVGSNDMPAPGFLRFGGRAPSIELDKAGPPSVQSIGFVGDAC